jgi:hypothetical protein
VVGQAHVLLWPPTPGTAPWPSGNFCLRTDGVALLAGALDSVAS